MLDQLLTLGKLMQPQKLNAASRFASTRSRLGLAGTRQSLPRPRNLQHVGGGQADSAQLSSSEGVEPPGLAKRALVADAVGNVSRV